MRKNIKQSPQVFSERIALHKVSLGIWGHADGIGMTKASRHSAAHDSSGINACDPAFE